MLKFVNHNCNKILLKYSTKLFTAWTKDTGNVMPELTSFEEKLKHSFLDLSNISTAKLFCALF